MNLIELIKNLFKHHKNNTNVELVRPLDMVKIPKRKEFNNDTLVDYYKNEYSSILSTMKDYDTLILEADELNNHIKMTIDLLFYISIKEAGIKEKSVEDRINYLINSEKLDLYKNDINTLQSEVIGRLLAISEIRKELFLSKKKKEAIDNVIDRLCLSLITLYSIEVSIINNIERYKNESKYNSEPSKEEKEKEYEIIDEKIKHLNWLQQILDNDSQINIRTDVNYILKDLALIEKKLEEYTYIHKVEITDESKNEEINKILEIPFDIEHKDELLKKIEEIEIKYRVFYEYREYQEYGDIAIDESDLTNIYNLKFSALSINKDGIVETFVNKDTDKLEIEYYQNIIFSMIQDIIMGKNEVFNEIFSKDYTNATNLLLEFLKNEEDTINYETILRKFFLLNIILSFNTKDGFNNFCNNVSLDCAFLSEKYLLWNQYLPISTVAILKHYNFNYIRGCALGVWPFILLPNNICDLYYLYKKNNIDKDNYFYFPEGIKRINITNDLIANHIKDSYLEERKIIDGIIKDAEGKILVFPDSLEEIDSFEIENNNLKGIVLNNNLKKLDSLALAGLPFEKINIPSSLESIDISSLQNWENLSTIQFDNFHKLKLFESDSEQLQNLFYQLYQFIKTDYNLIKINNIRIDKSIKKFIFTFDDMENIEVPASYFNVSNLTNFLFLDISESSKAISNKDKNFNALEYFANNFKKKFYELLLKRRDYFMKLQQVLPDSEQIHISSDPIELVQDIKLIETKLKNYVANNEDFENEIHYKLQKHQMYNQLHDYDSWEKLENIEILKLKIQLFLKYSNRNLLSENDLLYLYSLKFQDLAYSEKLVETFINENTPAEDLEYYKKVIMNSFQSDSKKSTIMNLIKNILKDGEKEINPDRILNDAYLLNIFLCSENTYHIYKFGDEEVSIKELPLSKYKIFKFDDYIPLDSLCEIYNYTKENYQVKFIFNNKKHLLNKDFFELYNIDKENYNRDSAFKSPNLEVHFSFPRGIKEINTDYYNDALKEEKNLLKKIREEAENMIILFPNSLRVINGNIFGGIQTLAPIFNEGLTDILGSAFSDQDYNTLHFQSPIKNIDDNAFNFDQVEELDFCDIAPDKIKDLTFIYKLFKRVIVVGHHKYTLGTKLKKIVFRYTDLNQEITIDIKELLDEERNNIDYYIDKDTDLLKIILDRIEIIVRNSLGKEKIKSLKK